jgi:subtilase family serine protease
VARARRRCTLTLAAAAVASIACLVPTSDTGAAAGATLRVAFGPISPAGMRRLGRAPANFPVTLQLGLVADQDGMANAARAGSDPSSPSYGRYATPLELRRRFGAPIARQRAVLAALHKAGIRGTVDAVGVRITARTTIAGLQRVFSRTWSLYATGVAHTYVGLPGRPPIVPRGLRGNVDVAVGLRPVVVGAPRRPQSAIRGRDAGGTPIRTGTPGRSCVARDQSLLGLSPDQILAAYGITSLHDRGLLGQGARVAIVGEAPARGADVERFRSCFGFSGTPLAVRGGTRIKPILESSLDAMVVATVAPKLEAFDLYVRPLTDNTEDGDVEGFLQMLAAPLEATKTGRKLPDVVSVSYGVCEAQVAPFGASRKLVERTLAAYAALGVTVVVAAGDSGSSTCARGIPASDLTSALVQPVASWPASSQWVLAVGGTNLTLKPDNSIASTGVWNDTVFPAPFTRRAGGGGALSRLAQRPWWQPAQPFASRALRMVPDLAAFADPAPGYMIVCSRAVQGCPTHGSGQSLVTVGGTSAATPLVAGMIALWTQQARDSGRLRLGFIPPLLYSIGARAPHAFADVTVGNNKIFNVGCCDARVGYDLASGLGSPLANVVADNLTSP